MPGLLKLFQPSITAHDISDAQAKLHLRKKLVKARQRMLKTHVRQALGSKKALAGAGATGFVVGMASRSGYCKDCGKRHTGADMTQLMRVGLKIYTLSQTANSLSDFITHDW